MVDPRPNLFKVGLHVLVVRDAHQLTEHLEKSVKELLAGLDAGRVGVVVVIVEDGLESLEARVVINEKGVDSEERVVLFGMLLPPDQVEAVRQLGLIHLISPQPNPNTIKLHPHVQPAPVRPGDRPSGTPPPPPSQKGSVPQGSIG